MNLMFLFLLGFPTFPQQTLDSLSNLWLEHRIYEQSVIIPTKNNTYLGNTHPSFGARNEKPEREDIIIGDEPAETLLVQGPWIQVGNIFIINDGVLIFRRAQAMIDGNITAMNNGKILADSSYLLIYQRYMYERYIFTTDSVQFIAQQCTLNTNGYQFAMVVKGQAQLTLQDVFFHDWTATWLYNKGKATLRNINYTGEYIFADSSEGEFDLSHNLLAWFYYPNNSQISFTYPDTNFVCDFVFDENTPGVDNIDYRVSIDSCLGVKWGLLPQNGSNATILSSKLSFIGVMCEGNDSIQISGLVNNQYYSDYVVPLSDRYLRLTNTHLNTWTVYSADSSFVDLSNCIIGDFETWKRSFFVAHNFYLDGTGGGSAMIMDSSRAFISLSAINADVMTRSNSFLTISYSGMAWGSIKAADSSSMVLINTTFPENPIPYGWALVWVASISGPSYATAGSLVPIVGSSWIDRGPQQSDIDFDHYRLWWRELGDTLWNPVGSIQQVEVRRDTLDNWNTAGLEPGSYVLRLVLKDNMSDSVSAFKGIILEMAGVSEDDEEERLSKLFEVLSIGQRLIICYSPDVESEGLIDIYNVAGQKVAEFPIKSGEKVFWSAPCQGVFFVKLRTSYGTITAKAVILARNR